MRGYRKPFLTVKVAVLLLLPVVSTGCSRARNIYTQGSRIMEPTIPLGAKIVINRDAYANQVPLKWEVVAFEPPDYPGSVFVMRVIAVGGDVVEYKEGYLYLNGLRPTAPEDLKDISFIAHEKQRRALNQKITVPEDSVYVLGDNAAVAKDSRFWGPLPNAAIIGRVEEILPMP